MRADFPMYSRKKPTGFSSAHHTGLLFSMIRRQAITIFKPSCGFLFRASALQFNTENSVQGGGGKNAVNIVRRLVCKNIVLRQCDISNIISCRRVSSRPAPATSAEVEYDFRLSGSFVNVAQGCVSSFPLMSSQAIVITVLTSRRRLMIAVILLLSNPFGVSADISPLSL